MVLGETMSLITVIIPARKEPYIRETLKDLYDNAAGEIEVIVFLTTCRSSDLCGSDKMEGNRRTGVAC